MKGHPKIIKILNALLAEELTAINQYIVHAEMCDDWEYHRLHELVEKRAIQEMQHAEKLIGRILFLEGSPTVDKLNKINIGKDVAAQLSGDKAAETTAIKAYNAAIKLAVELGDNGTREMLEAILGDEESHVDWIEGQLDQIDQMGIERYLAEQIKG